MPRPAGRRRVVTASRIRFFLPDSGSFLQIIFSALSTPAVFFPLNIRNLQPFFAHPLFAQTFSASEYRYSSVLQT